MLTVLEIIGFFLQILSTAVFKKVAYSLRIVHTQGACRKPLQGEALGCVSVYEIW